MTPGGASTRWLRNVFERRRAEGSGGERASRLRGEAALQLADVSSPSPNYPLATPPPLFFPLLHCLEVRGYLYLIIRLLQGKEPPLPPPPTTTPTLTLISQSFSYPDFLFKATLSELLAPQNSQAGVRATSTGYKTRSGRFGASI